MAFSTSGDIGSVRLEIGDSDFGVGVKPTGKNFTDAEIQTLLTAEGSVGCAAARACEILARQWSRIPDSASMGGQGAGSRSRSNNQVQHFRDAAKELRQQYGGGNSGAFAVGTTRNDGFHINNEFDDDDTAGEFSAHRTIYIRE